MERPDPARDLEEEGIVPPFEEDDEKDDRFAELGEDQGALSAEEAAMHWFTPPDDQNR